MRVSRTVPALLALCLSAAAVGTADPAALGDVEATGEPNAAYLDAARRRGLQTEVMYLRPDAPLPEGEVAVPDAPSLPDPEAERRNWAIAAAVLLVLVLGFAAWYGRGIPAAFGTARDPARHADRQAETSAADDLPPDALLARLAALTDRRRALILLVASALERAAGANGLRLGRSQTARDVLRVLPARWPHLDALRRLVSEAELVHFGGRDLAEERWQACIEQARPLFAPGQAG